MSERKSNLLNYKNKKQNIKINNCDPYGENNSATHVRKKEKYEMVIGSNDGLHIDYTYLTENSIFGGANTIVS